MRHISQGLVYSLGAVAPVVTTLCVTPLVVRLVGGSEYGLIALAYSIGQAAALILAAGLPAAITRHTILEQDGVLEARGLINSGAVVALSLAVTASLVVLATPLSGETRLAVVAAFGSGAGLAIVQQVQAFLRGVDRPWLFVLLGAMAGVVPNAVAMAGLVAIENSASVFVMIMAAVQMLIALGAILVVRIGPFTLAPRRALRLALRIGLPTVPHQASVSVVLVTAVLLARHLSSGDLAGRIQVAALLGTGPIVLLQAANNAWAPLVYRTPRDVRPALLERSTGVMSSIAFLLNAAFVLTSPLLIRIVGGPLADEATHQAALVIASSSAFFVAYLANIHHTFIDGRTWPLALTSPMSWVVASGIAYAAAYVSGHGAALATIWLAFYSAQTIASWTLARVSSDGVTSFRSSWVPLFLAAALPLLAVECHSIGSTLVLAGTVSIVALGYWWWFLSSQPTGQTVADADNRAR